MANECNTQTCIPFGGMLDWFSDVCADSPDDNSTICNTSTWYPPAHISYTGGIYHVSLSWLQWLEAHQSNLWTCDNAFVEPVIGGLQVYQANAPELLYALGLRNGDILKSINGIPLATTSDIANAYASLVVYSGATSFTLVLKRGTSTLTRYYQVS